MSELIDIDNNQNTTASSSHGSKYVWGRSLSLSQKVVGLIAIGLVIYSIFVLRTQEDLIENTLLDQSKKQALVFLHGLEREIAGLDDPLNPVALQDIIRRAKHDHEDMEFSVFRLYIYDKEGNVLADSSDEGEVRKNIVGYKEVVLKYGRNYIGDEIEWKRDVIRKREIPIVEVLIPLHLKGDVAGVIEVEVDLERTQNTIQKIDDVYELRTMMVSVVAGLIMLWFLWLVVHRSLLSPIKVIGDMSNRIADGDFGGRIQVRGQGELAQLGRAVNAMADGMEQLIEEQEAAYIQVLQSLAKALEAKDRYSAGHSSRVSSWSVRLAKHMGLPEDEIQTLKHGALMHDLGKIAVPDAILNKPDKLTDEEFNTMRSHPNMTAHILQPLRRFERHREIAASHHERWDGNGYPNGLKGEEIPLLARIVAIADTWDAMTGDRVYRKGMSSERALQILQVERESGQWDPEVVDAFIQVVRQHEVIAD